MKAFTVSMLLLAVALALYTDTVQAQGPNDRVNLAAQFDNRVGSVLTRKRQQVINAIAELFGVAPANVKIISGLNQSGFTAQSIVTFGISGPSKINKPLLAQCEENIRALPLLDSKLENAIEKATDTIIPGDKIEFEKGTCTRG